MKKTLPAVNIQYPISTLILSGVKTIETRTYSLPPAYLNRDMFIIETPGTTGSFVARIVGTIKFKSCFIYGSKKSFYSDFDKHLVDENSKWAWKNKPKWAWEISEVKLFKKKYDAPNKKGIIFTKEVSVYV